jgi:DNA invertase Pin-like site-specific DNA recombinase
MHPHHNAQRPARKRLAIAARVSTEDQEQYDTSLDDQVAKGRLLAQLHDYTVDDRPYEDGGHVYSGDESGTLQLAHRPIMRRLLTVPKGRMSAILICNARGTAYTPGAPLRSAA